MANEEHLAILKEGVEAWNAWRKAHPKVLPNLAGANFRAACLHQANLKTALLAGANLSGVDLTRANLASAHLAGARLEQAVVRRAILRGADLTRVRAMGADLTGADLTRAALVQTHLEGATLTSCRVYGVSVWNVTLDQDTKQHTLIITSRRRGEPEITVDNLEVAQFIYLLLNNQRIRHVIDTITSKVVLLLGRFTPERKAVLDALRDELRQRNYLPVVFDFEQPAHRSVQETVSTLAHMARFVIADITDPRSIPQELTAIVPHLPSVPVQPLLQRGERPWGMWEHFPRYHWVLPIYEYEGTERLLKALPDRVVGPAEQKAKELQPVRPDRVIR